MTRRFQFSLRALLAFAAVICVLLGGWHLLQTYGNRLDVENPRLGAPIRVKATYFCPLGPSQCHLSLGYMTADGSQLSDGTLGRSAGDMIKRSWLCLYSMESELEPVDQPCQLIIEFKRYEKPPARGGGRVWDIEEQVVEVN